jgi:NAD-dependent deacetylase
VVLFGQAMAPAAWDVALEAARNCNMMLTAGTSGLLISSATLPDVAQSAGAEIITSIPGRGAADSGSAARLPPALVDETLGNERQRGKT